LFGLSLEEIDFIVNYDAKYRTGADNEEQEDAPEIPAAAS
jgi:hypothetical protein